MKIYTDGATSNNGYKGSKGGWAFVIIEDDKILIENSGHLDDTTNNICELTAIINACKAAITFNAPVTIYSDSAYCINCYKEKWYKKWLANDWVNSSKKPVANRELWKQLIPFFENKDFTFQKVKGHSIDKWNNYVDNLAVKAKGV